MIFENAWRSQDVFREPPCQTGAKVRILDPVCPLLSRCLDNLLTMTQYIVPIIALFQGRVIDQPERAMTGTEYSTGGEVEHEVSGGSINEGAEPIFSRSS